MVLPRKYSGSSRFYKSPRIGKISKPAGHSGPWALKHYHSLGICKIYYSHFIFEVMYSLPAIIWWVLFTFVKVKEITRLHININYNFTGHNQHIPRHYLTIMKEGFDEPSPKYLGIDHLISFRCTVVRLYKSTLKMQPFWKKTQIQ